MTASSKFHCIILKGASPLWIGETFNLCGFREFFFQISSRFGEQNWTVKRQNPLIKRVSATNTAKAGFHGILSNVNSFWNKNRAHQAIAKEKDVL
ncbi:hypothetical protein [Geitlerinema sp. PCC 9228]|jgi:hypothetical protein|uniref:hypothetical protein n=1 Tax=Geitlerinema sp. PCC 9228 TaxID=111611 RepID=UPI0008F9DC9C|nr:hypothetical protein [Geitlerinema sp. PCC 9228]